MTLRLVREERSPCERPSCNEFVPSSLDQVAQKNALGLVFNYFPLETLIHHSGDFVFVPQLPPFREIGNLSNLGGHTCQLHGSLKAVSLGRLEVDRKWMWQGGYYMWGCIAHIPLKVIVGECGDLVLLYAKESQPQP